MMRATLRALTAAFALYMPTCTTPTARPTVPPWEEHQAELWEPHTNLANQRRLHQRIADGEQSPE
jgi:hypothetical protein